MGRFRIVFISMSLALAAIVAALILVNPPPGTAPVAAAGNAAIGGPFQLVDQNGRAVDQRVLNGKWTAVFFGYTYCPSACPTALQSLAAVQDKLGARARDFQIVFISIDPARDTPAKLKEYLSTHGFPQGVIGLTGTPQQVDRAAKAYRVIYAKQPSTDGNASDYLMDHTTFIYLMNPQGRFAAVLTQEESPQAEAAQIIKDMQSAG